MYKTKSGEEINTNERTESFIKKELSENESRPRILKAMIEAGRPLRPYEIAELSRMSKQRIYGNLDSMVSKGLILLKEELNIKYYIPQPIYLDRDLLGILYGIMLPFVKVVDNNTDCTQFEVDNREAILENIQMILKLFQFDIADLKYKIMG